MFRRRPREGITEFARDGFTRAAFDAEDERTVVVALFVSRVDERIDVTGAREGDEGEDERREERRRAVVAHEVRSIDRSSRACDAILGGDARAEAASRRRGSRRARSTVHGADERDEC